MSIELKWEKIGNRWVAGSYGARWYRVMMLKDGSYSAMAMGQKTRSFTGNHLGYFGVLDDAQDACKSDHEKGAPEA